MAISRPVEPITEADRAIEAASADAELPSLLAAPPTSRATSASYAPTWRPAPRTG